MRCSLCPVWCSNWASKPVSCWCTSTSTTKRMCGADSVGQAFTARQSFFALDFHELDRGLSQEERQAWNSIYASFRGHSALSSTVIGADLHSMNVRSRETGRVERRTMYCVVVLVYRVPVYIPATEMWMGEARPDYVLQNMTGANIDFIITKVDREGGYAIASRRQATRTQRYFFAHRPDLCGEGSQVKCRLLAVGPRRCLAECYGHDVDLTQRERSYTATADLRTQYHPGNELDCIVKGYDAAQRDLLVSVKETETNPFEGAEQRHPVGSRRYAVIAGKYGAGCSATFPTARCVCVTTPISTRTPSSSPGITSPWWCSGLSGTSGRCTAKF